MPLNNNWMRQNQVDILKYLPDFLSSDPNFLAIGNACSAEHETIRLQLQDIFEQFFVTTATWGLSYWENVLAITPLTSDDYESRRKRVLVKLQANQTSTVEFMRALAAKYYASNATITIEEDVANYAFRIIADAVPYEPTELYTAIQTYKPAHLAAIIVHLLYTSNGFYAGGIVSSYECTKVSPDLGFSANVSNSPEIQGGIVWSYRVTNIS